MAAKALREFDAKTIFANGMSEAGGVTLDCKVAQITSKDVLDGYKVRARDANPSHTHRTSIALPSHGNHASRQMAITQQSPQSRTRPSRVSSNSKVGWVFFPRGSVAASQEI